MSRGIEQGSDLFGSGRPCRGGAFEQHPGGQFLAGILVCRGEGCRGCSRGAGWWWDTVRRRGKQPGRSWGSCRGRGGGQIWAIFRVW